MNLYWLISTNQKPMTTKTFTLTLGLLLSLGFASYAQNSGDFDLTFGTDGSVIYGEETNAIETFQDIAIQDDQKIVTVGMAWDAGYIARMTAIRYLTDGSVDMDFGVDGKFIYELDFEALAYGCTITEEGKIIIAGATTDYQTYRVLLIQLNADGTLDNAFGQNGVVVQQFSNATENYQDFAYGVTLDADGNILISGSSTNIEGLIRPFVARFSADGVLDTSFGVNGMATIPVVQSGNSFDCIMVQPDGKILAAGTYSPIFLWNVMLLVRFNADGSLDTGFGEDGIVNYSHNDVDDEVFNMALTAEGNIVVAGFSATVNYDYYMLMVQFTPDGQLDAAFGTEGAVVENEEPYNEGGDIQVQPDGKIVVAGTTGNSPPGSFDLAVWKYNTDGTRDATFGENGLARHALDGYYGMLHGVALQEDAKIVAVGKARTNMNRNYFFVTRLENDVVTGLRSFERPNAPTIAPNPALSSGQVMIQFSEPLGSDAILEFYNAGGQLIHSSSLYSSRTGNGSVSTFVPANLSPGIYFVNVSQSGMRSAVAKLVILN